MQCSACGLAHLVRDTRDLPYTCKGKTTIIPRVTADFCPACGAALLDEAEALRASELMLRFNRQVVVRRQCHQRRRA
jgi:HTH-type transcriptional regulator / antitoxin MqsA